MHITQQRNQVCGSQGTLAGGQAVLEGGEGDMRRGQQAGTYGTAPPRNNKGAT